MLGTGLCKVNQHPLAALAFCQEHQPGVRNRARATSYPDAVQDAAGTIFLVHDFERTGAKQVVFHRFTDSDIKAGRIVAAGSVLGRVANQAGHRTLNAKEYDAWKAARAGRE